MGLKERFAILDSIIFLGFLGGGGGGGGGNTPILNYSRIQPLSKRGHPPENAKWPLETSIHLKAKIQPVNHKFKVSLIIWGELHPKRCPTDEFGRKKQLKAVAILALLMVHAL